MTISRGGCGRMALTIAAAAAALWASPAPAAGPRGIAPVQMFDGYIREVAREYGRPEGAVRDVAIEVLRRSGRFTSQDLMRIRGTGNFSAGPQLRAVSLLRASA